MNNAKDNIFLAAVAMEQDRPGGSEKIVKAKALVPHRAAQPFRFAGIQNDLCDRRPGGFPVVSVLFRNALPRPRSLEPAQLAFPIRLGGGPVPLVKPIAGIAARWRGGVRHGCPFLKGLVKVEDLPRSEEHTSELQSHSFISYAV